MAFLCRAASGSVAWRGMVAAAAYCRKNGVPYFGICLGLQVCPALAHYKWGKFDKNLVFGSTSWDSWGVECCGCLLPQEQGAVLQHLPGPAGQPCAGDGNTGDKLVLWPQSCGQRPCGRLLAGRGEGFGGCSGLLLQEQGALVQHLPGRLGLSCRLHLSCDLPWTSL